jgi:sulfite exporter TauE/SafE
LGVSSFATGFSLAEEGMSYGMLFIIGLFTSFHCIAMCGGINLSQTLNNNEKTTSNKTLTLISPGFFYNAGRLISYTFVGVIVGALGSVLTISTDFRSMILLIAGLFMLIMGLNMLGLIPFLRYFSFQLPSFAANKMEGKGPLVIGFLNGFLPCGPLQAMQLYALSTGNPIKGGIAMFLFCLGTIPLMFILGATGGVLSGIKGKAFSRRAMQVGAILVAAMGLVMLSNGLLATNLSIPSKSSTPLLAEKDDQYTQMGCPCCSPREITEDTFTPEPTTPPVQEKITPPVQTNQTTPVTPTETTPSVAQPQTQVIYSTLDPRRYPDITVKQGIPVKWIIEAPPRSIHGCNNRIIIEEYNINYTFQYGENIIEFVPENSGKFRYSCWMYMMFGNITVES